MRIRGSLACALATLALSAPPALAGDAQDETAKELFEKKCSLCHPTSRPLGKTKDRAGWESTVRRMQGKLPSHLSDAEVETIVGYLTEVRGP